MKLRTYLSRSGITAAELARRAAVSEATISLIMRGKRLPRPALARRIEAATGGAVSARDLVMGEPSVRP